jgi:hypothetical protein
MPDGLFSASWPGLSRPSRLDGQCLEGAVEAKIAVAVIARRHRADRRVLIETIGGVIERRFRGGVIPPVRKAKGYSHQDHFAYLQFFLKFLVNSLTFLNGDVIEFNGGFSYDICN